MHPTSLISIDLSFRGPRAFVSRGFLAVRPLYLFPFPYTAGNSEDSTRKVQYVSQIYNATDKEETMLTERKKWPLFQLQTLPSRLSTSPNEAIGLAKTPGLFWSFA